MKLKIMALAASAVVSASSAQAAVVTYVGSDNSVSSLSQMTNSQAAAARFDAAAPGLSVLTFEGALPSGVTVTGGSVGVVTQGNLFGFNTTAGGSRSLNGSGTFTFTFTSAINAFGLYATGLQGDLVPTQTVTFSDGTSQSITVPIATNGGGAFIGFTDIGKSIVSVSFNATNDIIALDDVRFGVVAGAVPEPATWAMMLVGFGMVAGAARYRRRSSNVTYA